MSGARGKRAAKVEANGHAAAARPRLQIAVTEQQRGACESAAKRACSDVNTWALAYLMRATGQADTSLRPVVITGEVADRLRRLALAQGISPDAALEQLLISGGS